MPFISQRLLTGLPIDCLSVIVFFFLYIQYCHNFFMLFTLKSFSSYATKDSSVVDDKAVDSQPSTHLHPTTFLDRLPGNVQGTLCKLAQWFGAMYSDCVAMFYSCLSSCKRRATLLCSSRKVLGKRRCE